MSTPIAALTETTKQLAASEIATQARDLTRQVSHGIVDKGAAVAAALDHRRHPPKSFVRRHRGLLLLATAGIGMLVARFVRPALAARAAAGATAAAGPMSRSDRPYAEAAGTEQGATAEPLGMTNPTDEQTPATGRMATAGGATELTGTATEVEGAGAGGPSKSTPLPPRGTSLGAY